MQKYFILTLLVLLITSCKAKTLFEREGLYIGKNATIISVYNDGEIRMQININGEPTVLRKTFSNSSTETKFIIEPYMVTFGISGEAILTDNKGNKIICTKSKK